MATKQTGKQKKAAELAAKAKATAAAPKANVPETALVPSVKKGALSVDVGPMVLAGWAKAQADDEKGQQLINGAQARRKDLLSHVTLAIVKAAQADSEINLATVFGSDNKAKNFLNDQIRIALGISEVVTTANGKQRVVYASSVKKYFPQPGENKESPDYIRKNNFRSNFATQMTKCVQAACGITEKKIKAEFDKEAGTLLLTGPAVKEQFGQASVLLDERQTIKDGDKEIKLKAKPSFNAIAVKAGESHDKVAQKGKGEHRTTKLVTKDEAVKALSDQVVKLCEKIGQPNEAQIGYLEAMQSAIEKVLNG
jgi:hypothetical protein